ncbi:MAG: lysophospholipid acyltransferase family protein [Rhizomicrobium sp.]|jgi:lyso-ornithine lipid O-acyltransferase
MQRIRAVAILIVFLTATLLLIPWQSFLLRFRFARHKTFPSSFNRFLCRLFGIRITVVGKPIQDRGVLMVANHTSYFDILVLSGLARISFVAKSEVANWTLFGTLAKLQETVFVQRAKRTQTVAAKDQIRERLIAGDALVLFPEGTSNDGNRVLPFKSALMGSVETEIGTDAQGRPLHVPVQPVSLAYVGLHGLPMGRENRPLYAWYGDMDLVPHLWEALLTGPIEVVVEFHPPMTVDAAGGRKALAVQAEVIVRRGQARALAGNSKGRPSASDPVAGVEKGELAEAAA